MRLGCSRLRDHLQAAGYEGTLHAFDGGHAVPGDALTRALSRLRDQADRRRVRVRAEPLSDKRWPMSDGSGREGAYP